MSRFINITDNQQSTFTLDKPEKHVFFLRNVSGEFVFEMNTPQAQAHIFALFDGKKQDAFAININQLHHAPKTVSHVTVKFLGRDESSLDYQGLIKIDKEATGCDASQKNTNLLLSDTAQAHSFPSLEILTDDVKCHHGSTTSRLNHDHLFYAQSRGLSLTDSETLLADGFVQSFFDEIEKYKQS
jgi:Fe-S cluster assembly protein SufD